MPAGDHAAPGRCWPRPSRCSRWPTATSAGAGTWTRASRTACRARYLNGVLRAAAAALRRGRLTATRSPAQTVINVTNGKLIRLLVDDEPFDVRYGELRAHERVLDFRAGTLQPRRPTGSPRPAARVRVRSTRLVSFTQRAIAAISYEVEPLDGPVRVVGAVRAGRQRAAAGARRRPPGRGGAGAPAGAEECQRRTGRARRCWCTGPSRAGCASAAAMDHLVDGPDGTDVEAEAFAGPGAGSRSTAALGPGSGCG